jgi:hypothetical protein
LVFCHDISSFGSVKSKPIETESTKSQNFRLRQHIQQIFSPSKFHLNAWNPLNLTAKKRAVDKISSAHQLKIPAHIHFMSHQLIDP